MKRAHRPLCCCSSDTSAAHAATDGQSFDQISRGRYLATVGDCAACHTTPGGKPYAGGRPLATPFGTLLAPNLTPDRETGIGDWSDDAVRRRPADKAAATVAGTSTRRCPTPTTPR